MKVKRVALVAAFLASSAILISCAASQDSGDIDSSTVSTYNELVAALRSNGSAVETLDLISQPFFEPEGQIISVDGYEVQVFEYSNKDDALLAAETIASDGGSIGTTMVSWIEAPHFFRSGRLIVLYVGGEDAVVEALQAALGPQIAGR